MFDCTVVFHENYNAKEKIIINQGGTSSSKTYSIMQVLFLRAIQEPASVITVTGESVPNLKKGAYRDSENIFNSSPELQKYISAWNKTDRIIQFRNGSLIEFVSNLDEQSARNGKRQYLFVNEAQGVAYNIFFQLAMRTIAKNGKGGQIFLDYNPSAPFFVHEQLINTVPETNDLHATVKLIISDHRHNCFLSDEQHAAIENIRDPDLWNVYARGVTGNLTGIIYPNWRMIPDDLFPSEANFFGGLDWGYTNDPTAGVKMCRVGERLFVHEVCYTPGLAPEEIQQLFNNSGIADQPVYCDSADPHMIAQCRRIGMICLPAIKGKGSILAGILKLKACDVYYTASSVNIHEERKRYVWVNDKITGKPSNTPIDMWDHALSAARYGYVSHYFNSPHETAPALRERNNIVI